MLLDLLVVMQLILLSERIIWTPTIPLLRTDFEACGASLNL